jgi:hypothetical protein
MSQEMNARLPTWQSCEKERYIGQQVAD